jgi:hypothetical protein
VGRASRRRLIVFDDGRNEAIDVLDGLDTACSDGASDAEALRAEVGPNASNGCRAAIVGPDARAYG